MASERRITLALTHYNRYNLLQECLQYIRDDPRLGEIVIVDDCSTDGSWNKLVADWQKEPRNVHLYCNDHNLDCYRNKREAVSRSQFPWVILFDSDNIIRPSYLDKIFEIPVWDPNVIYCPDFAEPVLDYTAFAGKIVSGKDMKELIPDPHVKLPMLTHRPPLRPSRRVPVPTRIAPPSRWRPPQPRPPAPGAPPPPVPERVRQSMFSTVLNTCNYFIHRDTWLSVWDGSLEPHTADSIYQAYRWLQSGRKMMVVPGLRYFHRIHSGSHYQQNVHKTGSLLQRVETMLRDLT